MSDTKPLLVLQYPYVLKKETLEKVEEMGRSLEKAIGAEVLILQDGVTSHYHHDLTPLIEALDRYTAATHRQSQLTAALLETLLTEEDRQDPDDEPMIGASMNSPRVR